MSSYNDTGNLGFWVKGGKNFPFIESLDICFKDTSGTQLIVPLSEFAELGDRWQGASLPLSEFTNRESRFWNGKKWVPEDFDWENVSGIVYVLMANQGLIPIEIFIDDLKIVNGNDTIYDVFSHFE